MNNNPTGKSGDDQHPPEDKLCPQCRSELAYRTVLKNNENKGRKFLTCDQGCRGIFFWADGGATRPKRRKEPGEDVGTGNPVGSGRPLGVSRPHYRLSALNKATDVTANVGAAWRRANGSIGIKLDPFVTLSNNDGNLILSLFPFDPNQQGIATGPEPDDEPEPAPSDASDIPF